MLTVEPNRTAVLVMDLQADIVGMLGDKATAVVERAAGVIAAARKVHIPIIYVVVGFRPGYPEISERNRSFATVSQSGRFLIGTPGTDIAPAVRPEERDVVVVKHRASAFAGTDLEIVLRAKGIDTLVLAGISTSGVILSTVRHGADADYRLVVVKDGCADPDDEVHRVLTEKILVRQATIMSASEVTATFQKAS
jgi:nicotinamidase-related amidase